MSEVERMMSIASEASVAGASLIHPRHADTLQEVDALKRTVELLRGQEEVLRRQIEGLKTKLSSAAMASTGAVEREKQAREESERDKQDQVRQKQRDDLDRIRTEKHLQEARDRIAELERENSRLRSGAIVPRVTQAVVGAVEAVVERVGTDGRKRAKKVNKR
jgi:chromosome segregation ATPase